MALNDLPLALQSAIQQGYLQHEFQKALEAKLGFRMIADKEPFMAEIGETITKTRGGLLPAITTPMVPAQTNDFTSGLVPQNYGVEQFILGVAQYAAPMQLNVATSKVAIASVFLQNAYKLGEQSRRSVDTLARNALYDQYMGGNTRVRTTLGSAALTLAVDDVRGFFLTLNSQGQVVPVSSAVSTLVVVGSNTYTLTGVVADGPAPTTIVPWMASLNFSGTGSNVSTTPGGYSGVLTFSTNVSVADGTAANAVQISTAPLVLRPSLVSNNVMAATSAAISSTNDINNGKLTMNMVLQAKATMSANNVPDVDDTGSYNLYLDPLQASGLFSDPEFQSFFRGKPETEEYRRGIIYEQLGVRLIETNLNPVQTNLFSTVGGNIRRGILCGQGALIEAEFTNQAYADALKVDDGNLAMIVDGIAHVTREPLDALKQVVTQTWSYIGGFVAPTDVLTNPNTIPTATNSAFKRAIVLESL